MARTATARASKADTVLEFDTDAILAREAEVARETDAEILARLAERFEILDEMTRAVKSGDVRAMIVSGPPGVGKIYGVETQLQKDDLFNTLSNKKPKFEVVKSAVSALGLYAKLYEYSEAGNVIVFDDSDDVFYDTNSLNLLKAALDTSAKRVLSWNTDSRLLRNEGIPDRFEFKGAVIFITNIKFEHVRSKVLKGHLAALESRCHYIDLQMDTQREKMLRIKQVINDCNMLESYEFNDSEIQELLDYVNDNKSKLRELSLRIVLKLADLKKSFPNRWQSMAKTTCFAS